MTIYETIKRRTKIPKDHIAMKSNEIVKGRTKSHDPIWNHKGKNRNPKCPYTHVNAVILWREEQKVKTLYRTEKGRTESHNPLWNRKGKNRVKGRTESYNPMWNWKGKNRKAMTLYKAHVPIWNREGKNSRTEKQKPNTLCEQWICEGKNRNPKPMYSYTHVKALKLWREEQKPMTLYYWWFYERKEQKPNTHVPIYPCTHIPM